LELPQRILRSCSGEEILAMKNIFSYAYDFGAVHLGNPKTYGVTLIGKILNGVTEPHYFQLKK
jgi:hypothetical protein